MRSWILGVFAALAAWTGLSLALFRTPTTPTVRAAALNYDADMPFWTSVDQFSELTRQAAQEGARIVVWPEMAIEGDPQVQNTLEFRQLAAETGAFLTLGYFIQVDERVWRNEATVLSPDGQFLGVYGKAHPVTFAGESSPTRGTYPVYETPLGGKVLLFPGDAQYGNWLSWATTPRGKDLLERTIFYKDGHHGSHNSTLKQEGLSRMTTAPGFGELTAMIPVDTEKAKTRRGWVMPEPALKEMLIRQAQGRVILACEGEEGQNCDEFGYQKPRRPPVGVRLSQAEWRRFLSAIKADEGGDYLWVEYTLAV